jgi:hypothetical protein
MASPYGRRFTPADIERIRELAMWGHSGDGIAKALNRDPLSIRKKCCALGIRLRKPSAHGRRFKISREAWRKYQIKGEQLGASPSRLVRLVAEKAADIIDAVIDAPVPRRRKVPAAPELPTPLPLPAPPPPSPFLPLAPRLVGMVFSQRSTA